MRRSAAGICAAIVCCAPVAAADDPVPSQCQNVMDAWCNDAANCAEKSVTGEAYFARFDTNKNHDKSSWRCYPASSLSEDGSHYVDPGTSKQGICSKDAELKAVLSGCSQCQNVMDAWCNDVANCAEKSVTGEAYFARFDTNRDHAKSSWRCYPASSLSEDRSHYVDPGTSKQGICSRDAKLKAVLSGCSGSTFVTTVFRGGTEGCVMYRTPSLLRVQNGSLLAFTQCRQKSRSDKSAQSIHLKHSHDDGLTWGPATILPFAANKDFSMQHRAATVYDENTGSIFLFDDARKIGSSEACEVQIWRSDDLGVSWASATNLTDDAANTTGSALATGVRMPSGKLVICMRSGCNGNDGGHKGDVALWSEDHGLTWAAGGRMSGGTNECQLTQLSNGSLLANSRTGTTDRVVSLSNDEGRTWLAARKEPALSGSAVVHSSIFSYGGDLFFSHPEASDRTRLTIRRSRDDGNTWPHSAEDSLLVWAGKSAYSSLGSTADGALAVLWEKDGADLGFARTFAFSDRAVTLV